MKKCPPQLAENPLGSGQAVLLVAAAFGLGWFLQTRKAKAAAAVCKVDSVVELNKWAATNGYGLMYFPAAKTTEPPTLPELLKDATWGGPVQKIKDAYGEEKVLLVLNENDPIFYLYKDGKPVAAPAVKASYCQSR